MEEDVFRDISWQPMFPKSLHASILCALIYFYFFKEQLYTQKR